MSLFEGLSIGTRGLAASQVALNVTGQNISNANTEGYSRKRVTLTADYREDGTYGQFGFGVDISSVERVRNSFIDKQVSIQTSQQGYYSEIDSGMERVENIFTEPSENGLNALMDNFWNAWQDLANNPGDLSSREALRSTSQVMVEQFHHLSNELRDFRMSINDDLSDRIRRVNELTGEIAKLNLAIVGDETGQGQTANDSRDRRDMLIEELSKHIAIEYFEDGQGSITVTTSGQILVSPSRNFELELVRNSVVEADGFRYTKVDMRFASTKDIYVPRSGEIKALIELRDETLFGFERDLDNVAKSLVTAINDQHYSGYNLNRDTGILFFDSNGTTASTIDLSAAVKRTTTNISAAVGGTISAPVGGAVSANLPAGYPALSMDVDLKAINAQYFNIAQNSVSITEDSTGQLLEEGADKDYVLNYETGVIKFVNTARFAAGDGVTIDFKFNDRGFGGRGDGENALKISALRDALLTTPDTQGNNTQSVGEYYSAYIGRMGIERNEAASNLETKNYIVQQLKNHQQQISGVNLDEEMANLIRYERTFQASARFMSTIGDMLEVLMNV